MIDHGLDRFRVRETDAAAMLALADPVLPELFAVWPLVEVRVFDGDEPATWGELWACERAQVDVAQVARLLSVSVHDASAALERAIELRVVYPDGTLHAKVAELMEKKSDLWRRRALGEIQKVPDELPEDD